MREFFRGWKRKVGVVTLVLTCVLAGGWIRSASTFDGVEIVSTNDKYLISSLRGQIRWFAAHSEQARVEKREIRFPSFTLTPPNESELEMLKGFSGFVVGDFHWMSATQLWGHYSDLVQTPGPPVSIRQVIAQLPYWSVVIPLTLLSTWLLLSKPRQPKSDSAGEQVPATMTDSSLSQSP